MSETQTAISFKLPVGLRKQIGEVIERHDLTLTGLVLDYFKRRVAAEKEVEKRGRGEGEKVAELTLVVPEGLHAALWAEASRLGVSVEEFVCRLCETAVQGGQGQGAPGFKAENYRDFPRLVECVRSAYLEDRSPVDALLRLAPTLAPAPVALAELFAAAIAAVPVDQVINERVELGLRIWREQSRGGG
jgi:hypothetical protein